MGGGEHLECRKGVVLIRGCFQTFHLPVFVVSVVLMAFLEKWEFIVFYL